MRDVCRQFMCPISLMCRIIMFLKNVGNNIKLEENMKTKNLTKIPPPPYYFFIMPKYILQFEFVKYKTHKGYRTHELTCVASSCVLYPLCVLYFWLKMLEIT